MKRKSYDKTLSYAVKGLHYIGAWAPIYWSPGPIILDGTSKENCDSLKKPFLS